MRKRNQLKVMLELHKLESSGNGIEKSEKFKRLKKRLDPSLLKRYQRLKEKKGTGIAVLKDGACSECRMVYPETHEILRYKNFVHSCEYCGRFLLITEKSA